MTTPLHDLNKKFAAALRNIENVQRTSQANAGTYTYQYTDLTTVLEAVKEVLVPENLALSQPIHVEDGIMSVTTLIVDETTGESLQFPGPGCPVKGDPQAAGSAITYFRRYALVSIFGLGVADDDGAMAHRAEVSPSNRTPEETAIRVIIGVMNSEMRTAFVAAFADEFRSTLTALPESHHEAALTFARDWENRHMSTTNT